MLLFSLFIVLSACQSLTKVNQFKIISQNPGKLSVATFDIAYYYKNSLYSCNIQKNTSNPVQNTNFSAGFSQLKGKVKQRYIILAEQVPDWSQRTLKFQIVNRVDLSFLTYAYTSFQNEAIIQSASLLLDSSYTQSADIQQFQIASITKSGKICGWTFNVDAKTVTHNYCVNAHALNATCIISANDGTNFITGGSDRAIRIWANGKSVMSFNDNQKAVSCLHVSNDQKYLISGNQGGVLKVYDYALYWLKSSSTDHSGKINSITSSNDSKIVASCGQDGFIILRNIAQNKLIQKIKVNSVATQVNFAISNYHPASGQNSQVDPVEYLYSSHQDGSVIVWKVTQNGLTKEDQLLQ